MLVVNSETNSTPGIDQEFSGNTIEPYSVQEVAQKCLHCRKCLTDCRFLTQNGTPGHIARQYQEDTATLQQLSFSCSLCNLCTQHCPLDLEPARMFLDLRREAVSVRKGDFKHHRRLLKYEQLGGSWPFKYVHLPPGATTIFFPGCALPGARPDHTLRLYSHLRQHDPTIGIILDCCNKPSHDLGRQRFFNDRFIAREQLLQSHGIRKIITACTNCYQAFSLNTQSFQVTTAYSVMADNGFTPSLKSHTMQCTIHDPCAIRFQQEIHQSVRTILKNLGVHLTEMEHNRATTLCCGEGGAAGCMGGGYAAEWSKKRHSEANGQPLVTYCAGCTAMLQNAGKVHHILDLLFPEAGNDHISPRAIRPPMTYINRLTLKRKLKQLFYGDKK